MSDLSEEEIKFRAYLLILNSEFPTHRKTEAMEELLKIYNKQQKEIKKLKDIEADYVRRMKTSNKLLLKQGYISKDKIKEKIKELEDIKNANYKQIEELYLKGAIEQIKELLEEE